MRSEGNRLGSEGVRVRSEGNRLGSEGIRVRSEGNRLGPEGVRTRGEGMSDVLCGTAFDADVADSRADESGQCSAAVQ